MTTIRSGADHPAAWGQLAEELGVALAPRRHDQLALTVQLDGHDICLGYRSAFDGAHGTAFSAVVVNPRPVRFHMRRAVLRSELVTARVDGPPSIADVEAAFLVSTNHPERLRSVLIDATVRSLLFGIPDVVLAAATRFGNLDDAEGANDDVVVCATPHLVHDVDVLRRMLDLVRATLAGIHAGPRSPFDVPTDEVPATFVRIVDDVAGSVGGDAERVGDDAEAHIPDPLGLVGPARVVVTVPMLPRLVSAMLTVEAPLVPGAPTFTVDYLRAFCIGRRKTGDPVVDGALQVKCDTDLGEAVVSALRGMAKTRPRLEVGKERLSLRRSALDAADLPALLRATFDLWQAVNRERAGAAEL